MAKILLADDSSVVRSQVSRWLIEEGYEVVTATNGREATDCFVRAKPDVVILDVEMPEENGLEALEKIRSMDREVPVVMFSSLTRAGSRITIDALFAGASDYATKPGGQVGLSDAKASLISKVSALVGKRQRRFRAPASDVRSSRASASGPRIGPKALGTQLIVVASSTGGPVALGEFLTALGPKVNAAVLIVQHMSQDFMDVFARRLKERTNVGIELARDHEMVSAGMFRLAPAGSHLSLRLADSNLETELVDLPPVNSCKPSADVLFGAAARVGARVLGVVLTGMGSDGLNGSKSLVEAGQRIIAQDQQSSVVWGMPGAVIGSGLASYVGNPANLGRRAASWAEMREMIGTG
jgi:two-component system chemotaxis response regulator CheB